MGNIFLTSNNIKDFVGRQVLDASYQNNYGIGVIVSTFELSGELGCRVHYNLDRLVLKHDGAMAGVTVNGPVSGTINTGNSYVRWDAMSAAYTTANPGERGTALKGMNVNPHWLSGATGPSATNKDFGLVRETIYDSDIDGTIQYYPDTMSGISGTISQLTLV